MEGSSIVKKSLTLPFPPERHRGGGLTYPPTYLRAGRRSRRSRAGELEHFTSDNNFMNEQRCKHGMSNLDWRVSPQGEVQVRVTETRDSPAGDDAVWQAYGPVMDVLCRVTDRAFGRSELTWRTELSYSEVERVVRDRKTGKPKVVKVTVCNDSDGEIDRIRADDVRREIALLGRLSVATGMRLDPTRWRMCSPNACIHFQFGPGVTVATDGTQVILFSFPEIPSDCAVVHRSNVIGPVTATPVRTSEWDYVANKAGTAQPGGERRAPKREANVALALQALLA